MRRPQARAGRASESSAGYVMMGWVGRGTSMARLVPLVLFVASLGWVGSALAQDRRLQQEDAGAGIREQTPCSRTTSTDRTAGTPPPAPAAPVACPPAQLEPSCSCGASTVGALIVGVGVGMVGMAQLQKRNRKMAPVGAPTGPRGVAKDNPMMEAAASTDTKAIHNIEERYEDTYNPLHPEPQKPERRTLAQRYGLPEPNPEQLRPEPEPEPKPVPQPQPQRAADHLDTCQDYATLAAVEDEDTDGDVDEYHDGQAQNEGEEFDVVVDVKTSDGGTGEQNFKVKTTETLGSVKRRMSLSMGLSPEQMAVLLGSGADASNDDETVGGLGGLITAETRIRAPQQAGLVACQFGRAGAKSEFEHVFIELVRGSITFREGERQGKVLRTAGVIGCTVGVPKHARNGHENAFRVDLAKPDSLGETKYVISVDTMEEMAHWMSIFGAYTALPPEQIASIAEAATRAAGAHVASVHNEPVQNADEQEQDVVQQSERDRAERERVAVEEEAERERARVKVEQEAAERERERLAVEKAEQERAQAEIARGMEAVKEAALQRSILLSRIPRCQGQVMCQFNGKKENFVNLFLELADGVLRMDGDGVLRSATVARCSVGELKKPRQGHQYAFRVDLEDADSAGSKKYVLSVDTDEEKQLWMSRLRAYTYMSVEEVAQVMSLVADVGTRATAQTEGAMDDYGDDT